MCNYENENSDITCVNLSINLNEELDILFKLRTHIELQISCQQEQINFNENECCNNPTFSSFINNFFNEYKEHFELKTKKQDLQILNKMMMEIKQQIKSLCKHNYEEDDIDYDYGEKSMKITYCTICYTTFK